MPNVSGGEKGGGSFLWLSHVYFFCHSDIDMFPISEYVFGLNPFAFSL